MIKHRVKSPGLLRRLMIVPPAIPHGRSDGFITAATKNRQKECISRGFKILSWETAVQLKHPLGHTRARTICLCNLLSLAVRWQLCPSIRPLWHYGMLLSTQAKRLIRLVSCWPPPPSLACMDLSGYRRTLHQLGGVSRLFWQPKGQIASFPNCIESRFHQWLSCQCVNGQIMTNLS